MNKAATASLKAKIAAFIDAHPGVDWPPLIRTAERDLARRLET